MRTDALEYNERAVRALPLLEGGRRRTGTRGTPCRRRSRKALVDDAQGTAHAPLRTREKLCGARPVLRRRGRPARQQRAVRTVRLRRRAVASRAHLSRPVLRHRRAHQRHLPDERPAPHGTGGGRPVRQRQPRSARRRGDARRAPAPQPRALQGRGALPPARAGAAPPGEEGRLPRRRPRGAPRCGGVVRRRPRRQVHRRRARRRHGRSVCRLRPRGQALSRKRGGPQRPPLLLPVGRARDGPRAHARGSAWRRRWSASPSPASGAGPTRIS